MPKTHKYMLKLVSFSSPTLESLTNTTSMPTSSADLTASLP